MESIEGIDGVSERISGDQPSASKVHGHAAEVKIGAKPGA